jgi:integrase
VAKVTTHCARDGRTLRYMRCSECTPACVPLGAISEEEAHAALCAHERRIHGREPRRRQVGARKALLAFYASRRADGRSKDTVRFYRGKLDALFARLEGRPPARWATTDLVAWIEEHPDWKPGQTRALLRACRAFLSWAKEASIAVGDFVGTMTGPTVPRRRRRCPTREEIARLIETARTWPDSRRRRWAEVALALAADLGFALGDIRALDWRQVDFGHNEVSRPRAKTGNPLAPKLTPRLAEILHRHRAKKPAISGPVLRDLPSNGSLSKAIREIYAKAGVPREKGDGLHLLRHACITHLLGEGIRPEVVADFVGDSVATILKTYAHSTEQDFAEAAKKLQA